MTEIELGKLDDHTLLVLVAQGVNDHSVRLDKIDTHLANINGSCQKAQLDIALLKVTKADKESPAEIEAIEERRWKRWMKTAGFFVLVGMGALGVKELVNLIGG